MVKATWPGAVARRVGLSGAIDFTTTRVGMTLHVPCKKGNHIVDFDVESGSHPDLVAKRMLASGWTFGSKLTCPEHSRRERVARIRTPKRELEPMTTPAKIETAAPMTTSDEARLAKRLVVAELEDHYDDKAKRYRAGHCDASIARTTGIAEAVVAKIRDEFFGPTAPPEPPELTRLRESIADAKTELTSFSLAWAEKSEKLGILVASFNKIAKQHGWQTITP